MSRGPHDDPALPAVQGPAREEYAYLFERTALIKTRFKNYEPYQPLADRTLAMIFEKASTRTRVASRPACTRWAARWCT
jgi:ornithine carbamoyltransferase